MGSDPQAINTLSLESNRQIKINFAGGDLSSDAGLLLIKEFVSKLGIDKLFVKSFKTNDSALFRYHTDQENLLQMIYTRFLYFHFPANTDIPTIKTVYIIESLKTIIRRAILIASKKLYPKINCLDFFA